MKPFVDVRSRCLLPHLAVVAAGVLGLSQALALVPGPTKTYDFDADFDLGILFNVNHTAPNNNQLQLSPQFGTFPLLWVANAGEDTVSKIDTNTGKEVGRYRTWFNAAAHDAWTGPAPSRTAIDSAGNCYVANRHFEGKPISVVKILASGFVDRNGDGIMQTSTDINNNGAIAGAELLDIFDSNSNGVVDPSEIRDERIAWIVQIPGTAGGYGRSLAIAPSGHIWVGSFNQRTYYKLDPSTGAVLAGPISVSPNTPYGAVVDASGILWGSSLSSNILKFDTGSGTFVGTFTDSYSKYGISYGNGKVYTGYANPVREFNPTTNVFSNIGGPLKGNQGFTAYGVSVHPSGDIIVHGSTVSGGGAGATRIRQDGSIAWSSGNLAGANDFQGRGCMPDSNGDVWTVNLDTNNVSKYNGTTGAGIGVYPVGYRPYSYSDATGSTLIQTIGLGKWTVVFDTNASTTTNAQISWNSLPIPPGATLVVKSAASNLKSAPGDFLSGDFAVVTNGGTVGATGRWQAVEVTLTAAPGSNASPVLTNLKIKCPDVCPPLDINGDGRVDSADQNLILNAIRARSQNLYYDVNCDGRVDIADSRYIALHFTP